MVYETCAAPEARLLRMVLSWCGEMGREVSAWVPSEGRRTREGGVVLTVVMVPRWRDLKGLVGWWMGMWVVGWVGRDMVAVGEGAGGLIWNVVVVAWTICW